MYAMAPLSINLHPFHNSWRKACSPSLEFQDGVAKRISLLSKHEAFTSTPQIINSGETLNTFFRLMYDSPIDVRQQGTYRVMHRKWLRVGIRNAGEPCCKMRWSRKKIFHSLWHCVFFLGNRSRISQQRRAIKEETFVHHSQLSSTGHRQKVWCGPGPWFLACSHLGPIFNPQPVMGNSASSKDEAKGTEPVCPVTNTIGQRAEHKETLFLTVRKLSRNQDI